MKGSGGPRVGLAQEGESHSEKALLRMLLPLQYGTEAQVTRGSTKEQVTRGPWSLEGKTESEPIPRAFPEGHRGNPVPDTGLSFRTKCSHPGNSVVLLCDLMPSHNLFAPQCAHLLRMNLEPQRLAGLCSCSARARVPNRWVLATTRGRPAIPHQAAPNH